MKELTVIIVNWNTKDDVCACLDSIQRHGDAERIAVVVVDNASRDGSPAAIASQFPGVTLINSGGNLGFGKANNLGLKSAATPFILFLNPDTVVEGKSLSGMLDFLKTHPEIAAVQCRQKYPDGVTQTLCRQWEFSPLTLLLEMGCINDQIASRLKHIVPYQDPETSGFMKTIAGGCMMVRREVLEKVGGFDERFFMYAEDGDLCRRIRKAGGRIYYLADEAVIHGLGKSSSKAGGEFGELMRLESYHKLMGKYYGAWGRLMFRCGILYIGITKLTVFKILNALKVCSHDTSRFGLMVQWSIRKRSAHIIQ